MHSFFIRHSVVKTMITLSAILCVSAYVRDAKAAGQFSCPVIFSPSIFLTLAKWQEIVKDYQNKQSLDGGPQRAAARRVIQPLLNTELPERVAIVQKVLPHYADLILGDVRLDHEFEQFTFEMLNLLSRRTNADIKDVVSAFVSSVDPDSTRVRVLTSTNPQLLRATSEAWVDSFHDFERRDREQGFSHQSGERRAALRALLTPYVGMTSEGRYQFLKRAVGEQTAREISQRINQKTGNEMYVFELLKLAERGAISNANVDAIVQQILAEHLALLNQSRPTTIRPWANWVI